MKKQKFFHITFIFENFEYSFGRNVLEMILQDKLAISKTRKGKLLADTIKNNWPVLREITLRKYTASYGYDADGRVQTEGYSIVKFN